ncbi:MAG: DnaA/Hda family protein [Planctomycetota bacterium]
MIAQVPASDREEATVSVLARDLWQQVREVFEARFGPSITGLWFKNLRPLAFRRGTVWLGAPNAFVKEFASERYGSVFEEILRELTGSPVTVCIVLADYLQRALPPEPAVQRREGLDFVLRPENRTAYASLVRSLKDALPAFNPIFIYGPHGAGKTALLRWYLRRRAEEQGSVRAAQLMGERFTRGFTTAVRCGQMSRFRGDILSKELLVLDEAHRLADRPATQREFLSVLKHFVERNRQVLLLSRHHPREIFHLDPSLCSHFLAGLVVSMGELSLPSRVAILEAHAARFRRTVARETIEVIAGNVTGSLRAEISVLKRAAALAALREVPLTAAFVREHFPEVSAPAVPDNVVDSLLSKVCELLEVDRGEVVEGRKTRRATLARHMVIYLAATVFGFSARRIGRSLGTVSPSVVPYARRRVGEMRRSDPHVDDLLRRVRDAVGGGQQFLF